ncbi:MAG: ferritin-like domain-containing protein [Rhizobiales bacterium]|nr:ferritin-like domain-containing protein [Hyphomicrobiales bacterium]
MAAKQKELNDLFHDTLKDIFHAEKQLLRALPKMARAANSDEVRQAFETHKEETQGQVDRLEQVFEIFGKRAQAKPCEAMQGLVAEGQEIMEEFKDSPALDAGLISAAQAVEHYEIARYGTLRTWAQQLGMDDAAQLLEQTLEEEKKTDALLTQLAESTANQEAESDDEADKPETKKRASRS